MQACYANLQHFGKNSHSPAPGVAQPPEAGHYQESSLSGGYFKSSILRTEAKFLLPSADVASSL